MLYPKVDVKSWRSTRIPYSFPGLFHLETVETILYPSTITWWSGYGAWKGYLLPSYGGMSEHILDWRREQGTEMGVNGLFAPFFFAGWIETIWDVFKVFIYINLVNEFILELFLCVNQSDLNPFQRFSITHWIPNIRAKVERLILRSLGFTSRFVFFFLIPKNGGLKTREFLQKDPRNSLWILVGKRESSLPKTWVLLLMVQKSGTTVDNR